MRDHRPDGVSCEAAEVAEPALDQSARFPALVRSAILGEDADDINYQGVALFRNQTDVSADCAFRHGRDSMEHVVITLSAQRVNPASHIECAAIDA